MAITFEWDPKKAAKNLRNHPGVSFDDATYVFQDRVALEERDDSDPNEERWRIIGNARGRILFVVYTERDNDVIRLISARKANKREEQRYLSQATL